MVSVFGEAFSEGSTNNLLDAISKVVHTILTACTLIDDQLDRERYSAIQFHDVTFNNTIYEAVDFDVASGWVSFHHSLQWLLAELFKHIDLLDEASLETIGLQGLRDVCLSKASEEAMLTIIDYPLRGEQCCTCIRQLFTNIMYKSSR